MDAMAIIDVPHLQVFVDRHGHKRHYYRRAGYARVTLPDPSSPLFWAAYNAAARHAPRQADGVGSSRVEPGSVSALIAAYYQCAEYAALRASTQRGYRNLLDRFRGLHGHRRVSAVTTHELDAIFDEMAVKTPGAARSLRKRLQRVFRLAVKMRWRKNNPVTETDAPKAHGSGFTPWSDEACSAFEKRWPSGSRERRAYALLLHTGQRRSDVVGMGRQHVKAGRIHVVQIKTGARVAIRIHPALQVELDATPPGDMSFILTAFGDPFSAAGFSAWFRERAEMAGLEGLTPHGLRKAAGRRLAEAGCSAKEIMAVLGHATMGEAARYTRDADQTLLADAAVERLVTGRASTLSTRRKTPTKTGG